MIPIGSFCFYSAFYELNCCMLIHFYFRLISRSGFTFIKFDSTTNVFEIHHNSNAEILGNLSSYLVVAVQLLLTFGGAILSNSSTGQSPIRSNPSGNVCSN